MKLSQLVKRSWTKTPQLNVSNGGGLNVLPNTENRARMSILLMLLHNNVLGVLVIAIRQGKSKVIQIGKEKVQLSLFKENPKEYTFFFLKIKINEF